MRRLLPCYQAGRLHNAVTAATASSLQCQQQQQRQKRRRRLTSALAEESYYRRSPPPPPTGIRHDHNQHHLYHSHRASLARLDNGFCSYNEGHLSSTISSSSISPIFGGSTTQQRGLSTNKTNNLASSAVGPKETLLSSSSSSSSSGSTKQVSSSAGSEGGGNRDREGYGRYIPLDNSRLFDELGLTTFTDEDIAAAFDRYDLNGDGVLQREEVTRVFQSMFEKGRNDGDGGSSGNGSSSSTSSSNGRGGHTRNMAVAAGVTVEPWCSETAIEIQVSQFIHECEIHKDDVDDSEEDGDEEPAIADYSGGIDDRDREHQQQQPYQKSAMASSIGATTNIVTGMGVGHHSKRDGQPPTSPSSSSAYSSVSPVPPHYPYHYHHYNGVTRAAFIRYVKAVAEKLDRRVYPIAASMLWTGVSVGIIIPIMPIYVQSLGISTHDFGMVISAFGLSKLLGNIPSAVAVERYGRKPFLSYPLFIMAAGTAAIGLAQSVNELIACRLFTGLGVAGFSTAAMMSITDISTPLNRVRTTAPIMIAFSAGAALGPAIGGFMSSNIGVQPTFYLVGVLFAILGGINHFNLTETLPRVLNSGGRKGKGFRETMRENVTQWKPLLRDPNLRGIFVLNGAYWLAMSGSQMTLLPMILVSPQFSLTPSVMGAVFGGMSLVGVLAAQPLAAVADRFGKAPSIIAGCCMVSGSMVALPMTSTMEELAVVLGMWALGSTTMGSSPVAHVVDLAPTASRAQAMALLRTLGDVGLCLGATAAGALADMSSLGWSMQGSAAVLLTTTAWFTVKSRNLWGRKKKKPH